MNVGDTARAIKIECNRVHGCADCLYRNWCNKLFPCTQPGNEQLWNIEKVIYDKIFGCVDISDAMNEIIKGE